MTLRLRSLALSGLAALLVVAMAAQNAAQPDLANENDHLKQVVAQAGSSRTELIRGLEEHLAMFPESRQRATIEQTILRSAIAIGDTERVIRYGSAEIDAGTADIDTIRMVTRALLASDDTESAKRALAYAKRYEQAVGHLSIDNAAAGPTEQIAFGLQVAEHLGRALTYQARATGTLGNMEEAADLAKRAFAVAPTAESAREAGRWLSRLGHDKEALDWYADAFTIRDPSNTDQLLDADRARLRELWLASHDSETGLGDVVLAAYDRTAAAVAAKRAAIKADHPNFGVTDPLSYVLSGADGQSLDLSTLRGKVIVFDFWATWCGPCRAQQPLYEQVKEQYRDRDDVVFLNVNTDQDRSVVAPFLKANGWNKTIWFEDGLQQLFAIDSIPATIVIGKSGQVSSRINGFVASQFVDQLTSRIQDALEE